MNPFRKQRISAAFKHAKLSQKEFAKLLGVSQPAVSDLLSSGTSRKISAVTLAEHLKVPTEWIEQGTNAPAWCGDDLIGQVLRGGPVSNKGVGKDEKEVDMLSERFAGTYFSYAVRMVPEMFAWMKAGTEKARSEGKSEREIEAMKRWFSAMQDDFFARYTAGKVSSNLMERIHGEGS